MEEDVIILIKKFRVTNDNNYFNMIFQNLYPLMILKIKGIFREDREDAIQILSIELLDVVRNATLYESCFLDKKYFCDENEKLIKNRETSKIDQMFSTAFLEQYLISNPFQWELLEDAFHSTESFKKFNEQYSHYVCKIKILSLLLRKFSTAISKFQKKLRKEKYYEIVSLNEVNEYGNEFIDLIPNEDNQVINLEDFVFEDEDLEFLKMFIQDDELLSQSEVANKFKLANCLSIETFTYANEGWKDRLVSIEKKNQSQITNQVITYDKYGYPTNYKGTQLTWNKKGNLLAFGNNTYEYNYQGVRVSKTIGGEKTKFYVDGTKIIASITGSNRLLFHYAVDKLVGFKYNNNEYIYRRNIQGDITHIYLDDGTLVAEYKYDAFGNHTITNYTDENIGEVNPFRYRGYYYDTESDLFYLNSRYYDSKLGRFISPDALSILEETKGLINGLNLYMYCADNPVMYVDPSGYFFLSALIAGLIIGTLVGSIIGGVSGYQAGKELGLSDWELIGATLLGFFIGAIAGGVIGGIIGAGVGIIGEFIIPILSSLLTTSFSIPVINLFTGTIVSVKISGSTIVAGAALLMFSYSGKRPDKHSNNQSENKFIDYLQKKYKFSNWLREILHDEITGKGYTKDIIKEILEDLMSLYHK